MFAVYNYVTLEYWKILSLGCELAQGRTMLDFVTINLVEIGEVPI